MSDYIDAPAFSASWWDKFIERTSGMSQPQSFRDVLPVETTREMRKHVLAILAEIARNRSSTYGLRLWIDGEKQSSLDSIYDCSPQLDEDIAAWLARAFGEREVGIILNRGEKFSQELSSRCARYFAPVLAKLGMPTEGMLFTVFIGNYDNTPLGIHKDSLGKSVLHLHLGPGPKTMFTWDDEPYTSNAQPKPQNNFDYGPHLPYATRHEFGEGDVYFMPENRFHLGSQRSLSIGIACWFYNRANDEFGRHLLNEMYRRFAHSTGTMLKPDRHAVDDVSGLDVTLASLDLPAHLEQACLKDLLRETYKHHRYAMYSNGGFRNSPLPTDDPFVPTDRVRISDPFRMLVREIAEPGRIALYVRGTCLEIIDHSWIREVIRLLNEGAWLDLQSIQQQVTDSFSSEHLAGLLELLFRHRGIVQESNPFPQSAPFFATDDKLHET